MSTPPTLYVCWGLFRTPSPGHPCRNAFDALARVGVKPNIVRCYGWGLLPRWLNRSNGRREVRRLTGRDWVPVLLTTDHHVIAGSPAIRAWAEARISEGAPQS
jgi:hypothetical protein